MLTLFCTLLYINYRDSYGGITGANGCLSTPLIPLSYYFIESAKTSQKSITIHMVSNDNEHVSVVIESDYKL